MPGDLVVVDGKAAHGTIFRGGQSNAVSADGRTRIGILGVLPYPILLDEESTQITRRWVAAELNQPGTTAADQAKSITPRRFVRTDASTPLPDCSVVIFDRTTIDFSRLPQLPKPYDPTQASPPPQPRQQPVAQPYPQPGGIDIPRPLTQIPQARNATAPGYAAVPATPPAAVGALPPRTATSPEATARPSIDQPLQRDEEERVRDLLTSPGSVAVERGAPDSGIAAQRRQDTPAGRVSLNGDTGQAGEESSRAAAKPFSSFIETDEMATTELELQPRPTTEPQSEIPTRIAPPAESQRTASETSETQASDRQSADARESDAATAQRVAEDSSMPFPAPVKSTSESPLHVEDVTIADSTGDWQQDTREAHALSASPAGNAVVTELTDARSVELKQPAPWNWPLVSVVIISCFAAAVTGVMMLVVARQDGSQPTPVVLGERYWLDRIIQNELPIEDEPVELPQGEQLFGKAVPIRRLDAAHQSVPKPHFLAAGGESGIRRTSQPTPGDPESTGDDSPVSTTDPHTPSTTPYRDDRPGRSRPAVPMRPAAERRTTSESDSDIAVVERLHSTAAEADTAPKSAPERVQTLKRTAIPVDGESAEAKAESETDRQPGRTQPPTARQSSSGISLDISRLPSAQTGSSKRPSGSTDIEKNAEPARRSLRVDNGHQGLQRSVSAQEPAVPASVDQAAAKRPGAVGSLTNADSQPSDAVNVEATVEPSSSKTPPVPRPRFLQRQRNAAVNVSAESKGKQPQQDIAIEPARSVADTGDLLDRVLSSVQDEKRGDR